MSKDKLKDEVLKINPRLRAFGVEGRGHAKRTSGHRSASAPSSAHAAALKASMASPSRMRRSFKPDSDDDGLLTASKIATLKLNADCSFSASSPTSTLGPRNARSPPFQPLC